ncbi:MAG: restriction endonuclease subunit S [Candidatus Cloacimonetes bacterium]|nr:restriction endonuclease subunit S [Candidatus Cloacimonadota bacterium]
MGSDFLTFGLSAELFRKTVQPGDMATSCYIGLEHINQGSLSLNGHGISSDVSSAKSAFSRGDILFGKLRPYFRKVILAPFDGLCSTDIWVVRSKKGVDQKFLFYWMASQEFVNFSMQGAEGTRMPRAKWEHVSRHAIPYIDISEQRAIAHILGSLDDKIELNRKTNETLEAMAQAIFKSWFVDFDPVIDNALAAGNPIPDELQDRAAVREALGGERKPLPEDIRKLFPSEFELTEEMGWVPKRWEVLKIGNLLELAYGKSLAARVREPGPYPVYGSGGVGGFHKKAIVNGPGIIVGRKGTVGSVYWEWSDFFPIDTVFFVKLKNELPLYWVYQNLMQMDIASLGADSAVPGVNRNSIYDKKWVVPSKEILTFYWSQVETFSAKMLDLSEQNMVLGNIRDTLLPKLISGEIRIPDAEKLSESAA